MMLAYSRYRTNTLVTYIDQDVPTSFLVVQRFHVGFPEGLSRGEATNSIVSNLLVKTQLSSSIATDRALRR